MPEMRFHIRWPDGSREACYAPSLIIKDYIAVGQDYPVEEFVSLSCRALRTASDRVHARYGFACGRAQAQIARIEAAALRQMTGTVYIEAFEE